MAEHTCKYHGYTKWVYVPEPDGRGSKLCTGCLNDGSWGEDRLLRAAEMYPDLAMRSYPVGENDVPVALAHGYIVYEFSLTAGFRIAKLGSKAYEAGEWNTITEAMAGALVASETLPLARNVDPRDFSGLVAVPRRSVWDLLKKLF